MACQRAGRKKIVPIISPIGPVDFVSAWEGQIAMTAIICPKFINLMKDFFTPIGYNGRGITTGTLFGQSMAENLVAGDDPAHLPLTLTTMSGQNGRRVGAMLLRSIFALNQLAKSW